MFLILKGQLGVHFPKTLANSVQRFPPPDLIMVPGELAGELAFALRRPRSATLTCLEDCALLVFGSSELFTKLRQSKLGVELEAIFNRKLLSRVIENVWNNASFFRGEVAPQVLAGLETPWFKLLNHSEMETFGRNLGVVDFTKAFAKFEGVCVLASGRVRMPGTERVLDGQDYPILTARFAGEFSHSTGKCLLVDEVRVLKIDREAIFDLGLEAYMEVLRRIRQQVASQEAPIAVPVKYDVLLSHNSKDKPLVRELKKILTVNRVAAWLDEDDLRPGLPWAQLLEMGIQESASVAVLVGKDGLGPWELEEMNAALQLAVKKHSPVIPVLLPGAPARPDLPMFLTTRTWVDLRKGFDEKNVEKLVWGITGKKGTVIRA